MKITRAHGIGIGGIHVSAVAKLLLARSVSVSGSDAYENEETADLRSRGAAVAIGHRAENVPEATDVVFYSHAVPPENAELVEAKRRGIRCVDTHAFLAELFEGADQIVVTGTHGKSTTTAMLGLVFAACGMDPTVVVGTKCAGFPDGNLRIGNRGLLIVEGDEYRSHVLSYAPSVLVLNNIEYDHPDAFPTSEAYADLFKKLLERVVDRGVIFANVGDPGVRALFEDAECASILNHRNATVITFGESGEAKWKVTRVLEETGRQQLIVQNTRDGDFQLINLLVPGAHNAMNAAAAAITAIESRLDREFIGRTLANFPGCWRRFERIGTSGGAIAISDYGHHPTEVAATLAAAREAYPDRRIILAFQPHHRNRTRHLFNEFIPSFDGADVLLLVEIYDVPGREDAEDASVSSTQLVDAVLKRDAETGKLRSVVFVPTVNDMADALAKLDLSNRDLVIFMGAGAIDAAARAIVQPETERVSVAQKPEPSP